MSILNGFMNGLFNVLLFPFRSMPPLIGLIVFSVAAGVVFLLLFKYTSPQETIRKIKNRIKAGLYEVRLYKDDLGVIFRANKSLMANNLAYIGCCLIPLVPMILLILPILVQLDSRFGMDPLKEGARITLKVVLSDDVAFDTARVSLEVPEGLTLEAGPVRIPSNNEMAYRLKVDKNGAYELGINVNGQTFRKRIDAVEGLAAISPVRLKSGLDSFWHPMERTFPSDAAIESVELRHSRKDMLGMNGEIYPWLIIFCVVAIVAGFAMKGVFNVAI